MPQMTDSVRKKSEAIHAAMNAELCAARENKDLTPEGRQRQIAAAYLRAKQGLDALRRDFAQAGATTSKVLSRDIFGAASTAGVDAISVRDAADRAARLGDPQEALSLLQMADENGDEVLARAVAQQSYRHTKAAAFGDEEWSTVLAEYLGSRPEVAEKVARLEEAQAADLETNFRNEGYFFLVPPSEVSRLSDSAMAALTSQRATA